MARPTAAIAVVLLSAAAGILAACGGESLGGILVGDVRSGEGSSPWRFKKVEQLAEEAASQAGD